ncbi:MAG TPA: iron-containing alcohol dehydrogenase [bacterium]|nr:iron-containing alcohol dehydrogenase [bacterium]
MKEDFQNSRQLLQEFKGDAYLHGVRVLSGLSDFVKGMGKRAVLIHGSHEGIAELISTVENGLHQAGIELAVKVEGARPNAPREDLFRMTEELNTVDPDLIVSLGGGSTLDCAKAAEVLRALGGDIDDYFGTGLVTKKLAEKDIHLTPHVAIQTAAGSAAHLTKYSNITDLETAQKKLIVDEAIIPERAGFDYAATATAPESLTIDGALDGISHNLEVFYGATGSSDYSKIKHVVREAIRLIVHWLPRALDHPSDLKAREPLGLGTDLGGYAIMLGGTNGGHLTSFSLVDVLSHGRACGLLNPYYTVFFAPAVTDQLRVIGNIFREDGYIEADAESLNAEALGHAVARGMIAFYERIGVPTRLSDVDGFTDDHITRALSAARNPQLKMKLENMPVPLSPEMIDDYMSPILEAAKTGDLSRIRIA